MKAYPRLDRRIPAVVIGMNAGGLGVTRSLASAGISVIAVDDTLDKAEMATRHAVRKVAMPIKSTALIDCLLDLAAETGGRAVLISTLRLPSLQISEHREKLKDHYRFLLPGRDLIVDMENKERLIEPAAKARLTLPRTLILSAESTIDHARTLNYPVILKPADNDLAYMERFKKAYILDHFEAVERLVQDIWPYYRHLILQEWVQGSDEDLYFCLQYRNTRGVSLASFVGRKLLSWPPGKGATAACTAAKEHQAEVEELTNRLFDQVGIVGFGSVELKRDGNSGKFYLIEPTVGRTDQQEEIATLNGVNLPLVAYCDLTGQAAPPQCQTAAPHSWREFLGTRWARQDLKARGQPVPAMRIRDGHVFDVHFRIDDPLPGLLNFAELAPTPIKRLMRRLCLGKRALT